MRSDACAEREYAVRPINMTDDFFAGVAEFLALVEANIQDLASGEPIRYDIGEIDQIEVEKK